MRISRIQLQGFRTIDRGFDCRLQPLTIFTGANNSGKSSVIRALDLFFSGRMDASQYAPHVRINPTANGRNQLSTILITVWFCDLPDQLAHELRQFTNASGGLPVRLRVKPRGNAIDYLVFPKGNVIDKVDAGEAHTLVMSLVSQFLVLRVIPESRDVKREFQTELGEAFATMRKAVIKASHERAATAAAELHQALDEILDDKLAKTLNSHLGQVIPEHFFRVGQLDPNEFARLVMQAAFSHYPMRADSPDTKEMDLEQVGAGFQSMVLIALYRAVASLLGKKLILCVEEPEIHLDPSAQRRAYHEWSRLSSTENDVEQIILTSHSAFIVNEANPEEIVVLRRDGKRRTVASQLPPQFLASNDVVHLRTKVLGIRNSDIFFSRGVILVEGESDAVAVRGCLELVLRNRVSSAGGLSLATLGVAVIECGGWPSIPPLAKVLRQLDIPYVAVFDRDVLQEAVRDEEDIKSYEARFASSFYRVLKLLESTSVVQSIESEIAPMLCKGVPATYPQDINQVLGKHNMLVARTEHETDFIDPTNARQIARVVEYKYRGEETEEHMAMRLREEHHKAVKKPFVTALILERMSSPEEVPISYRHLCDDILRVLKLTE